MYRPFKHSPLSDTCSLTHRAQAHISHQALLPQQSMGIEEPEQKDLSSMRSSFVDSFFFIVEARFKFSFAKFHPSPSARHRSILSGDCFYNLHPHSPL